MATIALIGPDGAGKTSVAEGLLATSSLPLKYLYMGTSIESSNVSLPTSRLAHRIKVSQHRRSLEKSGRPVPAVIELHGLEHRVDRRGRLAAFARLLKRVSEETYRQVWSWIFQRRGHVVLYDRHFFFDSYPPPSDQPSQRRLTDRIHNWFLFRLYPRPDLVIFLDASPEVLFARKQEVPVAYLEESRQALREKCEYARAWAGIDASASLADVLESAHRVIDQHRELFGG